jgi:hypothetical protein
MDINSPELEKFLGMQIFSLSDIDVKSLVLTGHSCNQTVSNGKIIVTHNYTAHDAKSGKTGDLAELCKDAEIFTDVGTFRDTMIKNATRSIDALLDSLYKPTPRAQAQETQQTNQQELLVPTDGEFVTLEDGTKAKLNFKTSPP